MSRLLIASLSLLAATVALSGCSGEAADTHPDQPVTKRRALFKEFTRTLEPMGMVARERQEYKAADFLDQALVLKKLSTQPWPLFTADSNYPPTHAKPAVWSQPAEFKAAQQDYQVKVGELVNASQRGDLDAVKASINAVEKSCKACHTQFRNDSGG